MVLRKPYAFLIKHFKLIHLIISFLLGITAYKSQKIYNFINQCIDDPGNKYDAYNYVNYIVLLYIIIAIILMIFIRWLLKYKDKPRKIYLFSILYYGVISIVLLIVFIYLGKLPSGDIVQKTIRIYRDIMLIVLLLQYIITLIMLFRGLGFDIKKFDFRSDMEEMQITEEDAEEIEVNAFSKVPKIVNRVRKEKREFGYYYKEYKLIINIILCIIGVILIYNGFKLLTNKTKKYKEGDAIGVVNRLVVSESFYREYNNKNYIVVKFKINTLGKNNELKSAIVRLKIDKQYYSPNKNICFKFGEKGTCYKRQMITKETNEYIFVYEVKEFDNSKTYIDYNESYDKKYLIKLSPKEY